MHFPCYIVDAFTGPNLKGNPAAVVILHDEVTSEWMQDIAAEFNLSETAFVVPDLNRPSHWQLRWFTPKIEVALCGHATLATAVALWDGQRLDEQQWHFQTQSGELVVGRDGTNITLDFPTRSIIAKSTNAEIERAVYQQPVFVGDSGEVLLLELDSAKAVREFQPDFVALGALAKMGVIITAPGDTADVDCVSRFFAPNKGVPEDPVTGAAHCTLVSYWGDKLNKTHLTAVQASQRGGLLKLHYRGDRVTISGEGKLVMRGELQM